MELRTHKIDRPAKALAQWCTSWSPNLMPLVQTPGTNPRGIMCLLDSVLVRVQAPRWVARQRLTFASSFSGSGASNHAQPTMGLAVALPFIATAIPLRRWRMMARSKAHDPLRQSAWSAADRAANYVVEMAAPLAPSNLL